MRRRCFCNRRYSRLLRAACTEWAVGARAPAPGCRGTGFAGPRHRPCPSGGRRFFHRCSCCCPRAGCATRRRAGGPRNVPRRRPTAGRSRPSSALRPSPPPGARRPRTTRPGPRSICRCRTRCHRGQSRRTDRHALCPMRSSWRCQRSVAPAAAARLAGGAGSARAAAWPTRSGGRAESPRGGRCWSCRPCCSPSPPTSRRGSAPTPDQRPARPGAR